ncbi:MAG TPA: zinc metallopeptidase [Verrucomicrobiae bacterium]|jgi:Zn-dependent membrane protease YugP|nr:zinc metallopeptidase [Verrucomicrobiae bacterium]
MFYNSFYWDPWYLLMIPGLLLGLYAQFKLNAAYSKYLQVGTRAGLSGAEAAREILDQAGLTNMPVGEIPGRLTDHFDPMKKALFLSSENFHGRSLSAVGVAAHESGHALQQQAGYALFNFRMLIAPATQFASVSWGWIFLLGLIVPAFHPLINISIGIFSVVTLFQVVTLPVEYDASRRAKQQLVTLGLVQADEAPAVSKVLDAAAMTYVAGMLSAFLQLLRLIMIANNGRSRR